LSRFSKLHGVDNKTTSIQLLIPHKNYLGAVLSSRFVLRQFLRIESHNEIFLVEDLYNPDLRLEARVYEFRGIDHRLRKYRVRHIKRLEGNSNYHYKFIEDGWTFVITKASERIAEPTRLIDVKPFRQDSRRFYLPITLLSEYPALGRSGDFNSKC
jgi:hypothetical protein